MNCIVTKIKKELIHKAKVKKAYAKIKAREEKPLEHGAAPESQAEPAESAADGEPGEHEAEEQLHPTRKLMLKDEDKAQANAAHADGEIPSDGHRRRTRRPGYYDKQLQKAEQSRAEAEARRQEFQRRREERERKLAERERFKKAMAKTRDKDGKKKLGREGNLLLDKVKKIVAQGK